MTKRTTPVVAGFTFCESPRWHAGELWFSDFHDERVLRLDSDGKVHEMAAVAGEPSGLGWLPDGRLLVVSMHERKVLRQEAGGLELHADLSGVATFHCNDMVVGADGTAYVGNFGAVWDPATPPTPAKLARISPAGDVSVAADGLIFPNGMAITPDGKTLLVAETRADRVSAFEIAPDGSLSKQRVWAELESGPDGMCIDAEGMAWVALPMSGQVVRVAEGGEVHDRVAASADIPTACMLGGPDRKTLYVTTAIATTTEELARIRCSRIERIEVDVPGVGFP